MDLIIELSKSSILDRSYFLDTEIRIRHVITVLNLKTLGGMCSSTKWECNWVFFFFLSFFLSLLINCWELCKLFAHWSWKGGGEMKLPELSVIQWKCSTGLFTSWTEPAQGTSNCYQPCLSLGNIWYLEQSTELSCLLRNSHSVSTCLNQTRLSSSLD